MAGFDYMELCDGFASHQSQCSIYPVQRIRPENPVLENRVPVASAILSDLSQQETDWSMSSVSAQSSHDNSASSEPQHESLLSALAAEARQLWESASLAVDSPPLACHSAGTALFKTSALMPEFAGNFAAQSGLNQLTQPKPMPTFAAAAAAVHRRRSINDAINTAAAVAASSAFNGKVRTDAAELEEFSLGPGCPSCPP